MTSEREAECASPATKARANSLIDSTAILESLAYLKGKNVTVAGVAPSELKGRVGPGQAAGKTIDG